MCLHHCQCWMYAYIAFMIFSTCSGNGIRQISWQHDSELDDRVVTSHLFSCHDVTTTLECLKACSTLEECNSVFIHKQSMFCCLSDVPMHSVTNTTKSPTTRHYVHSWVTQYKASPTTTPTSTSTTTTPTTTTTTTPTTTTTTTPATTTTSTTTTTTTPTTTTTTTTTTSSTTTTTTTTTTPTTTTTTDSGVPGFVSVSSIPLTFKVVYTQLARFPAESDCSNVGARLINLNTVEKRNYVSSYLSGQGITTEIFFIAALLDSAAWAYKWPGGVAVQNPPWAPGEPEFNAKCVVLVGSTGEWKDDDCFTPQRYICEIP